jgi:NAD-dependent deacetylase
MSELRDQIERAAGIIRTARQVVAFTGAGVSTHSGIPDYRSPGSGLWEEDDPYTVASLTAFRYRPERFYKWVRPLTARVLAAQPNAAHRALAALEAAGKLSTVITQNIDGLHQRAGNRHVLEVHGSLQTATCGRCHHTVAALPLLERFAQDGTLPTCPTCGGVLKPNVILMEEQLPVAVFQRAREAARACEVLVVAGSSLEVLPSAGLPLEAVNAGAQLVIVNFGSTYLDERATLRIEGDVAEVLPWMVEAAGISMNDKPRPH